MPSVLPWHRPWRLGQVVPCSSKRALLRWSVSGLQSWLFCDLLRTHVATAPAACPGAQLWHVFSAHRPGGWPVPSALSVGWWWPSGARWFRGRRSSLRGQAGPLLVLWSPSQHACCPPHGSEEVDSTTFQGMGCSRVWFTCRGAQADPGPHACCTDLLQLLLVGKAQPSLEKCHKEQNTRPFLRLLPGLAPPQLCLL